jgi:hypothetical protein
MDPIAITDISSIILLQNLGEILLSNLNSPTYVLTPEQQTVIQHFVQVNPSVFDKLADDIRAITKDGKIDLYDIPFILQLCVDTYYLYTTSELLLSGDNIIVLIQYTLNVMIDSKFVVLPDYEKQVIEAVIYSCIQLLKTNIIPPTKSRRSLFSCF